MPQIAVQDCQHGMLMPGLHDEIAREMLFRDLTNYLEADLRPRIRGVYEAEVRPALVKALGREPKRREIARAMRDLEANRWWYALRTQSQRMTYQTATAIIERQIDALFGRAAALVRSGGATLSLDPALAVPKYLTSLDIHHLEGGYHTERRPDDIAAGAIYDRQMTVNRMGSQGALNDDPGVTLSAWVAETFPDLAPRAILEMGCTVGHNLLPFKATFPDAVVTGIDVAAPLLRYGHARALDLGVDVHFAQQNAEATTFASGSFDIVFSRILLHETSRAALPRIFAECHRLLRPGGLMFHSDAPQFDELDPYVASLRDWDITCNNEPFMETCYDLPLEDMYAEAGFDRTKAFRAVVPSRHVMASGIDPKYTRTGGSMFLVGVVR